MGEVATLLTKAEQALVDGFNEADWLPANDDRKDAIEVLRANGLPTRRIEAFHYTDLRARLRDGFRPSARPQVEDAREALGEAKGTRLAFVDGYHFPDLSADLPAGVTLRHGLDGLPVASEWSPRDAVEGLNAAFATDGVLIDVEAGTEVAEPIRLDRAFAGAGGHIAADRSFVHVGEGARATFVERHVGPADRAYMTSAVTRLKIADRAEARWIVVQQDGADATRLARISAALGEGARLTVFVLNAGGKLVRQEVFTDVVGEGAHLELGGVNLVGGEMHIDVTTSIDHQVPGATANETFRNVCTGRGTGVFQGEIKVAQVAQKTDARMACNTLLLSDECEFNAKPELEIFADDVQCAHGATVADLEDSHLFYLRSRGIPEAEARRLLIRAFVAEVVEELEDEALVEELEEVIDRWMRANV